MIFSVDTIKSSRTGSLNSYEQKDCINYEETNWFQLSLEMVLEESIEFNNMIYTTEGIGDLIIGAASDALNRTLKAINPYNILAKVFDWFVNSIATLGRHFEAFLLNFALLQSTVDKVLLILFLDLGLPIIYNLLVISVEDIYHLRNIR